MVQFCLCIVLRSCDWLSYCVSGVVHYAGGTLEYAGGNCLDNGKAKEQWAVESYSA